MFDEVLEQYVVTKAERFVPVVSKDLDVIFLRIESASGCWPDPRRTTASTIAAKQSMIMIVYNFCFQVLAFSIIGLYNYIDFIIPKRVALSTHLLYKLAL